MSQGVAGVPSQQTTGRESENLSSFSDQKTKVLIVDDEPRLCNSVKVLLELHGYICSTAIGGVKALESLKYSKFDVLLLDLKMPDLDGHQVMDFVKTAYPTLDVIIVSGETTFDEATWAFQQGAHDFLRKPYVTGELIRSIESAVVKRLQERNHNKIQKELLNSEHQHRFFVNSSPDIIYMLDQDGKFSFVNERISSLLGYSGEEILGKHFSEIVFQDDLKKIRFNFPEKRTGARASRGVEFRLIQKMPPSSISSYSGHGTLAVELNAMGVYSNGDESGKDFLGTYRRYQRY